MRKITGDLVVASKMGYPFPEDAWIYWDGDGSPAHWMPFDFAMEHFEDLGEL